MLIEVDAAQLEWRTALNYSHDVIGIGEVLNGVDVHSDNQKRFKFPDGDTGRLIAKRFLFRAIYRGPAYAYANDSKFMPVSTSQKFWQQVIDTFYEKYYGLAEWHRDIIQEVNRTGRLTIPTGRVYDFVRKPSGEYSEHDITNWPVQGLGAEFVAVARVTALRRYPKFYLKDRCLFVNTVHDSIVVDLDARDGSQELYDTCVWLEDIYKDIPRNFERLYGSKVIVPMAGECKYGPTWGDMKKFKRDSYEQVN